MVKMRQCRSTFSVLPPNSFSVLSHSSFLMKFSQTLNSILAGTLSFQGLFINLPEVTLHSVNLDTPFTETLKICMRDASLLYQPSDHVTLNMPPTSLSLSCLNRKVNMINPALTTSLGCLVVQQRKYSLFLSLSPTVYSQLTSQILLKLKQIMSLPAQNLPLVSQ